MRVVYLVVRGFREDECPLHASALTFETLLCLVPILALSLALARGLGDADTAKMRMRGMVSEWTQSFGTSLTISAPGALPSAEVEPVRSELSMLETLGGTFVRDRFKALAIQDGFVAGRAFQ